MWPVRPHSCWRGASPGLISGVHGQPKLVPCLLMSESELRLHVSTLPVLHTGPASGCC
jgi:hypothetical protein